MYPVDGETVPTAEVQTHFAPAIDIDGDDLSYRLVLWADDGETVVADGNDIVIDQELAVYGIWNTAVLLEEDRWYSWSVAAVDEHGAEGPWTEPEEFFYSRANQPPQTPVWIAPLHGDTVETTSPDLVSTETLDPEAGMVWFRFEVGPTPTLDTADVHSFFVQHSGDGEATWDLLDEGIELPSNQEVYARVRAEDSEGVASPWNAIAFFVTGSNDAPDVPLLLSPGNTARIEDVAPVLAARHVDDPEGDLVTYDFVVARDEALSVILATVQGVQAGSGPEGSSEQVSWQVPVNLYDGIYWSARAVDVHGAASDWAVPNLLIVDGYVIDVDEWEEAEHPTAGCDCEASISGGGLSSLWPLLVLLMPALRRRRFC